MTAFRILRNDIGWAARDTLDQARDVVRDAIGTLYGKRQMTHCWDETEQYVCNGVVWRIQPWREVDNEA